MEPSLLLLDSLMSEPVAVIVANGSGLNRGDSCIGLVKIGFGDLGSEDLADGKNLGLDAVDYGRAASGLQNDYVF
jgi:hypothetical protein